MKRRIYEEQQIAMLSLSGAMRGKRLLESRGFAVWMEKESGAAGCSWLLKLRGNAAIRENAERVLQGAGIPLNKKRMDLPVQEKGGEMP